VARNTLVVFDFVPTPSLVGRTLETPFHSVPIILIAAGSLAAREPVLQSAGIGAQSIAVVSQSIWHEEISFSPKPSTQLSCQAPPDSALEGQLDMVTPLGAGHGHVADFDAPITSDPA
jgi:hypothetical protein